MTFYLYSGAGNTFVVLDGREIISEMDNAAKSECECGENCECGGNGENCGCHHDQEGEHHCCRDQAEEGEHHCCRHHGEGGCCHGGGASPWERYVQDVCDHFKTDGLMLLLPSERFDFEMAFFNPDGTG